MCPNVRIQGNSRTATLTATASLSADLQKGQSFRAASRRIELFLLRRRSRQSAASPAKNCVRMSSPTASVRSIPFRRSISRSAATMESIRAASTKREALLSLTLRPLSPATSSPSLQQVIDQRDGDQVILLPPRSTPELLHSRRVQRLARPACSRSLVAECASYRCSFPTALHGEPRARARDHGSSRASARPCARTRSEYRRARRPDP